MLFLRQCLYAFTTFVVVALCVEALVPGAVSPFLDPVPWAIGAGVLLCLDAMIVAPTDRRWSRLVALGLLLFCALGLALLWARTGRLGLVAAVCFVGGLAVIGGSLLPRR